MPESYKIKDIKIFLKQISENKDNINKFMDECKNLYVFLGYENNSKIEKELNELYNVINNKYYYVTYNKEKYMHIICTIHSSKGLQYNQIIIKALDYSKINDSSYNNNELHYATVTRVEKNGINIKLR